MKSRRKKGLKGKDFQSFDADETWNNVDRTLSGINETEMLQQRNQYIMERKRKESERSFIKRVRQALGGATPSSQGTVVPEDTKKRLT